MDAGRGPFSLFSGRGVRAIGEEGRGDEVFGWRRRLGTDPRSKGQPSGLALEGRPRAKSLEPLSGHIEGASFKIVKGGDEKEIAFFSLPEG